MDNQKQLEQIHFYKNYLARMVGKDLDIEVVARIWIRQYAEVWRENKGIMPNHYQQ